MTRGMRIVVAALVLVLAADAVALIVWRINGTYAKIAVIAYELSVGPMGGPSLTAFVSTGNGAAFALVSMEERQDRVVVTIQEKADLRAHVGWETSYAFVFPLANPLGERLVIDGSTGRAVPERQQAPS